MELPKNAKILRIFVGEQDRYEGVPLHEAILDLAMKDKLAGATVFKGVSGFGCSTHIHTSKILSLAEDLPMVVEIVDSEEKINDYLSKIDGMIESGLIIIESAQVLIYRGKHS